MLSLVSFLSGLDDTEAVFCIQRSVQHRILRVFRQHRFLLRVHDTRQISTQRTGALDILSQPFSALNTDLVKFLARRQSRPGAQRRNKKARQTLAKREALRRERNAERSKATDSQFASCYALYYCALGHVTSGCIELNLLCLKNVQTSWHLNTSLLCVFTSVCFVCCRR